MKNSNPPDFAARIRFRIPSRDRLGVDNNEIVLIPSDGCKITLKSGDAEKAIRDSDWLILESNGWNSEETAEGAVERLMDALRRTLACHNMAADLGSRSPQGFYTRAGLRFLEERAGRPVLNDIHGAMVFSLNPQPMLARGGAAFGSRIVQGDRWKKTLLFALEHAPPLGYRERTAFDLYSVSHAARILGDARFVLLFAAIEALLESNLRPKPVIDHIDRLIALTSETDLDKGEKDSLVGSLKWLRSNSIRSSGRRFVREYLADRRYQDQSAEEVFLACYELRNRLIHGAQPFPRREEVGALVGALDQMVGHLLAGPVLDFDTA